MSIDAIEIFKRDFPGLASQFTLKPFQEKVINQVIKNGSSVAVMPTGGGKSLIYWIASRALGGTCLVVSPLIALIDEQADKLRAEGFQVLAIHGGLGATEQMKQLQSFATGELPFDFIFVSPERMATDGYFEYCIGLQANNIKLLVIDEVHCISQWGFDFRPFYKRIPNFLNNIFYGNWPCILGLTATINPKELKDVSTDFRIPRESILKDDILLRFDIDLMVEKYSSEDEKEQRLWKIIDCHKDEKVLVYLYRKYHKRGVEHLCELALQRGISAISFHGDMSGGDRQEIIAGFRGGSTKVVFATNAFGLGIDIPDIRVVVHFMLPESIEQYYQEIGRAGRDRKGATAYMLYSNKNIQVRKTHFIDKSFPSSDEIRNLFKKATNNEIGKKTLQYFSEEDLQSALSYYLNCQAISIVGKGFTNLQVFKHISDQNVQQIVDSSRTGSVITVLNKPVYSDIPCREFFNIIYGALVSKRASLTKNLEKCLIIEATAQELNDDQIAFIENETNEKRTYKHALLDYLVYVLDNFHNVVPGQRETKSVALHQEIGRYLGVNKHSLGKIYLTEKDDVWVRSKSEIIIANILYRSSIPFEYEAKLFYQPGKWKEPDFTITLDGKKWYWEHLGLLGGEEYNDDWAEKREIYRKLGIIEQVITTKESSLLSKQVNERINLILKGESKPSVL